MGSNRKFRNVKSNGQVAVVVDDLASRDPWTSMSREVIRITPTWVASWSTEPAVSGAQIRRS